MTQWTLQKLQKLRNLLLRIKPQFQEIHSAHFLLNTAYSFQRAFVKYALQKRKNVKLRLKVCHKVPEIETIYLMPCRDCTSELNFTYLAILLTDTAVLQNR